tara:strand:- start:404 stop:925 length:522 start_codon:yes stop_codon:yes gene_type:complete
LKIISGKYRNRNLKSLVYKGVRPTSAAVKKSLFQILEPFENKDVLDLFAGIGSLGIESISRGAASTTFVEKNRKVANVLLSNLNEICHGDNYELINRDVYSYIKICNKKYDIIFADPPYETVDFNDIKLKIIKLLNYKGIFCMERRFKKNTYEDVRIKNYGKTQFLIWQKTTK